MRVNLLLLSAIFTVVSFSTQANQATSKKTLPAEYQHWQQVGQGKMSWLWWELYMARLFTPDGKFTSNQCPMLLDIRYQRNITAKDLIKATVEQWQHLEYRAESIKAWRQKLTGLWPDVAAGDQLAFVCLSPDLGQFFYNVQPLSVIQSTNFADAFLAIWLSENTSRPELRMQLIGEKPCDC